VGGSKGTITTRAASIPNYEDAVYKNQQEDRRTPPAV